MMIFILSALLQAHVVFAQPSPEVLKKIDDAYNPTISVEETSVDDGFFCRTSDLRIKAMDAVTKDQSEIEIRLYTPKTRVPADRAIIILPTIRGENMIDRDYANSFCTDGIRAALVLGWSHDRDFEVDMSMHDIAALRALTSIRHVVDYLNPTRPNQIGLLGTSLGGITGSMVVGFERRINVATFIVGGIGLAEIMAYSNEKSVVDLREERMKKYRLNTVEDYIAALKKSIMFEPGDFVDYSGPKKVLSFVALSDSKVPTSSQQALARAFGTQSIDYDADHVATVIHTNLFESGRIRDFFINNLQ